MPAFFEFHDTILESIDWTGANVVLKMKAIRTDWPQGIGVGDWSVSYQPIEIAVADAEMEETCDGDLPEAGFAGRTAWIYDGSFKAATVIANPGDVLTDDESNLTIPASLSIAREVEIRFDCEDEDRQLWRNIRISGKSASLRILAEARLIRMHSFQKQP